MKYMVHRRNKIEELQTVDTRYGVEIDLRTDRINNEKKLILVHDPFEDGVLFENWIQAYNHGTLILNVKEDGLESKIREVIEHYKPGFRDYFFLDQSAPYMILESIRGQRQMAIRISTGFFETIDSAMAMAGKIDWAWIDCFKQSNEKDVFSSSAFPISKEDAKKLEINGKFKICLVSPELHGRNPETAIPELFKLMLDRDIDSSNFSVCTKRPDIWEKLEKEYNVA